MTRWPELLFREHEPAATTPGDTSAMTSPAADAPTEHPVYDRDNLPATGWGWYRPRLAHRLARITGPATVYTGDGPVVLEPGWSGYLSIDPDGNPLPVPDSTFRVAYDPTGSPG